VHAQDMSDSVFTETEMARAYREIGVRDPAFDMPAFLRQIKADVPTIIRAYLEGEVDVLKVPVQPSLQSLGILRHLAMLQASTAARSVRIID
jgi:predicted lipid-binding transport protein (Tim44 family)